jgi:hypothetical protein
MNFTNFKNKLQGKQIFFSDKESFGSLAELIRFAIDTDVKNPSPIRKSISISAKGRETQLLIGGSRSLEDLWCLTKYYFPDADVEDIIKYLMANGEKIITWHCSTHGKRMYRWDDNPYRYHDVLSNNLHKLKHFNYGRSITL